MISTQILTENECISFGIFLGCFTQIQRVQVPSDRILCTHGLRNLDRELKSTNFGRLFESSDN